jgi:hypothetical protein
MEKPDDLIHDRPEGAQAVSGGNELFQNHVPESRFWP